MSRARTPPEEAVSPILATLMLVAITVASAAAVYLVAGRNSDVVDETTLVLAVRSDGKDPAEWLVEIRAVSQHLPLDSFRFIYTLPNGTIAVAEPGGSFLAYDADLPVAGGHVVVSAVAAATAAESSVRFTFTDTDGNERLSPTDVVRVRFDDSDGDTTFDDAWPDGLYKLQIQQRVSSALLRELTRTV